MTDDGSDRQNITESRVREIVREEVRAAGSNRRQVLAALGVGGLAGLAGCGTGEPADVTEAGLTVEDGATTVTETTRTLDFGANLDATADGDRVRVDGRGIEVAAADGSTVSARAVELGPGIEASVDGETVTITRSDDRAADGGYVGRPGDLQSALDDAAADGVGRVRLVAGATYELGDSVVVPPDVVLDCTGSLIELTADVNGFELQNGSQLRYPHVRTTGVDGYSSSVFHVYPKQFDDTFGARVPIWTVFGGWSDMTPGEGTCIELHGSEDHPTNEYDHQYERNIYFCNITHNCFGGRRFAHLHREGGPSELGGHVNGNIIRGFAQGATTFVETNDDVGAADNMVNGNKFHLATQPGDNSEWLWYANKGKHNELSIWGQHWDYHQYSPNDGSRSDWWYIGEHANMNFLWRNRSAWPNGLGAAVVDDSDGASGSRYLTYERLGVPVDELADNEGVE